MLIGNLEFALKQDELECEVIGSYANNLNINFEGIRMRSGNRWSFSCVCFFCTHNTHLFTNST